MSFMRCLPWLCFYPSLLLCQNLTNFRVEATYIKVPVTIVDTEGRFVSDLTQEELQLFDEGTESPIKNFIIDQAPINVVLLLDVSGSVQEELQEIQKTALRFAKSFDREDRLALVTFSDRMKTLQSWTNKPEKFKRALRHLDPGYRTALYDALLATVQGPFHGVPGRKILVLITDGLDNHSDTRYSDLLNSLIESDVTLYIVSRTRWVKPQIHKSERVNFLNQVMKNILEEEKDFVDIYFREKEASLSYLAEVTGGRAFFPELLSALKDTYTELAKKLKNQYILTFLPPNHSKKQFRTIQVSCKKPVGRLYHRTRYKWVQPR